MSHISLASRQTMYLAYSPGDANALRFENADIAGEVLELGKYVNQPEQLSIEG